jgi:hypothetical protein
MLEIRPQINHMKLDKHTRRLFLSSSMRIARSKYFLFISLFSLTTCGTLDVLLYTHNLTTDLNVRDRLNLASLILVVLESLVLHGPD